MLISINVIELEGIILNTLYKKAILIVYKNIEIDLTIELSTK